MRRKLPNKRFSVNLPVTHTTVDGKHLKLIVTVGYDENQKPMECFCAAFKSGSDNHSLIIDACILASRLLQHGDTPLELLDSMCKPLSLIGTIVKAILDEETS